MPRSRAAQVYWLAKCHTPLASAIWPKRPNTQHQTTATYKTSPHRTHRPYPKLVNTQSSHLWICDIPTPSLHPTTSSTSNRELHHIPDPPQLGQIGAPPQRPNYGFRSFWQKTLKQKNLEQKTLSLGPALAGPSTLNARLHALNCTAFASASTADNILPKGPGPRAV